MQERLSLAQRAAFVGASEDRRDEIEYESSLWMVACPCGWEQSVWDLGGVRYRAKGTKTQLRRCDSCGKRELHQVYYSGDSTQRGIVRDVVAAPGFTSASETEPAGEPGSAMPIVASAGMSFGAIFALAAVAKIVIEKIYSGPTPSWFLVFLIAGALAGSRTGRAKPRSSFSFGCLIVMLLMFLFATIAYVAKIRELT